MISINCCAIKGTNFDIAGRTASYTAAKARCGIIVYQKIINGQLSAGIDENSAAAPVKSSFRAVMGNRSASDHWLLAIHPQTSAFIQLGGISGDRAALHGKLPYGVNTAAGILCIIITDHSSLHHNSPAGENTAAAVSAAAPIFCRRIRAILFNQAIILKG